MQILARIAASDGTIEFGIEKPPWVFLTTPLGRFFFISYVDIISYGACLPFVNRNCLLLILMRKNLIGSLKLIHVLIIGRTESSHGGNENGVVSIVLIKVP